MATTTRPQAQSGDPTLDNLLEVYARENRAAETPEARNQALSRFKKAAQNLRATDSGADRILAYLDQIPGKEVEGMQTILGLRDNQIRKQQDLQTQRAALQMDVEAGPERARSGMYSMAAGLASFLRIIGKYIPAANGLADTLEESVSEWKPRIAVDTRGITSGAEFKTSLDKVINDLKTSETPAYLAQKGVTAVKDAPVGPAIVSGDIPGTPAAAAPAAAPATAAASGPKKSGWDAFRANLISAGLSPQDAEKVLPYWTKSAATSGDKNVLDPSEAAALKLRINASDLTAGSKATVKKVLEMASSEGPIADKAKAGPA